MWAAAGVTFATVLAGLLLGFYRLPVVRPAFAAGPPPAPRSDAPA